MNRLKGLVVVLAVLILSAAALCEEQAPAEEEDRGYLNRPPVYLRDDRDIPIATFGVFVPKPGTTTLISSAVAPESSRFVADGASVQPYLKYTSMNVRLGLLHGFHGGYAAGFMVPWSWQRVRNGIGTLTQALPATGDVNGLGGVMLLGKKMLYQNKKGDVLVFSAGLELPTGEDNAQFDQDNAVTNAYYRNYPKRMPLSWQPANGAYNASFTLGYLQTVGRLGYEGILAYKSHGKGDEDVKLGNIWIASASATYGISKNLAVACDLIYRNQGNDSYPNAPNPALFSTALAGTTTHGTSVFLDPSIRWNLSKKYTVGVGLTQLLKTPDDGMVPRSKWFVFLYPNY